MSLRRHLSLVTLGVGDLAAATAFYERLGWTRSTASRPTITFIQLDNIVLALFPRAELAKDAGLTVTGPPGGEFSGITLAHNVDSATEVDQVFDAAIAAGARAVKSPEKVFWGGYSGYFADPDGHLWEVAHNPFAPMDARGIITLPETEDGGAGTQDDAR